MNTWCEPDRQLRLVEPISSNGDTGPQALACYGLLARWRDQYGARHEGVWLRFVDGRPVSTLTTRFLAWCAWKVAVLGKRVLLLVWDNAAWHRSREVRAWVRDHNRGVKRDGRSARILVCCLPIKSPWLNPIEATWVHGKRRIAEPTRALTAAEVPERVCAALGCAHETHLRLNEETA